MKRAYSTGLGLAFGQNSHVCAVGDHRSGYFPRAWSGGKYRREGGRRSSLLQAVMTNKRLNRVDPFDVEPSTGGSV